MWAANLAAIELHVPQWRVSDQAPAPAAAPSTAQPDLLVLDLDPGAPATVVDC